LLKLKPRRNSMSFPLVDNVASEARTENLRGPDFGPSQVSRDMEGNFGARDGFPRGEASAYPQAVKPIASSPSTGRNGQGRMLALTGIAIAGLAAWIGLAQFGLPSLSPRQTTKLRSPVASIYPIHRRPVLAHEQAVSVEFAHRETGEEEQRLGVPRDEVVGGNRDEVDSHLTPTLIDREHHPGFDAVVGGYQQRVPVSRDRRVEEAAVTAWRSTVDSAATTTTAAAVQINPSLSPATHNPTYKLTQQLAATPVRTMPRSRYGEACDARDGLELARCMEPEMLAADRQLRHAYDNAVRSGVPSHVLIDYRRQWSRMRSRAIYDPRSVAAGYRQMAEELDNK
jgi:hypothetical protein